MELFSAASTEEKTEEYSGVAADECEEDGDKT